MEQKELRVILCDLHTTGCIRKSKNKCHTLVPPSGRIKKDTTHVLFQTLSVVSAASCGAQGLILDPSAHPYRLLFGLEDFGSLLLRAALLVTLPLQVSW